MEKQVKKKKAALVLSGGSALGLSHIGVIEELVHAGYEFDAIYGVSAGSIVGAAIAFGYSPQTIEKMFFETNFFKLGWDISRVRSGLIKGVRISHHLNTLFNNKNIEDLAVPFSAGAVDFQTGEYVQIKSGNIASALRASFSLPVVFEAVKHKATGCYLVDGGLVQNLPLREAVRDYRGDTIIAINVHALSQYKNSMPTRSRFGFGVDLTSFLSHTYAIMINAQHKNISDPRVSIIEPDLSGFGTGSYKRADHAGIIEAGRRAGREFLQQGQ